MLVNVLVVDDSAFMRKAISEMIESDPALTVIATARDGEDAVAKAKELRPDCITMDIEMPKLNGLEALRAIMRDCPTKVLMCSSLTTDGSREALRALKIGACDFIAKDSSNVSATIKEMRGDLVHKIKAICGVDTIGRGSSTTEHLRRMPAAASLLKKPLSSPSAPVAQRGSRMIPHFAPGDFDLLVIGSSTGGPPVLETLLAGLPSDLSVPIVIAQHMPKLFTKSMSERLDSLSMMSVMQAESGMPLHPGVVYVGEGGRHVRIARSSTGRMAIEIGDQPAEALYKPSVNELFASAAKAAGSRCLGVMCTGMGDDGVIGTGALRQAGGKMIAQNEETCVVYGMPKAVVDAGLANWILAPEQISQALTHLAPSHSRGDERHRTAG
ncbi:MAG: chemotaxis response regulator protein-glutamate methylesterase [Phycisphaeraceae bacterium]|nr:chemotaxis response regulator protein-glutamate methylesterase [Phycisphaeraceae bacterium]